MMGLLNDANWFPSIVTLVFGSIIGFYMTRRHKSLDAYSEARQKADAALISLGPDILAKVILQNDNQAKQITGLYEEVRDARHGEETCRRELAALRDEMLGYINQRGPREGDQNDG